MVLNKYIRSSFDKSAVKYDGYDRISYDSLIQGLELPRLISISTGYKL